MQSHRGGGELELTSWCHLTIIGALLACFLCFVRRYGAFVCRQRLCAYRSKSPNLPKASAVPKAWPGLAGEGGHAVLARGGAHAAVHILVHEAGDVQEPLVKQERGVLPCWGWRVALLGLADCPAGVRLLPCTDFWVALLAWRRRSRRGATLPCGNVAAAKYPSAAT